MATQGNEDVLFISFNQDASSLAVGTKKAYRLYALNNVDELQKLYEQDVDDVCIVERLFSSSLVLIVSQSAPRKLRVCHFQRGVEICHHSFNNTILAVRLNRLRVIVCLEESLFIHNIRDMKVLHSIRDTPPNPQGLCELTVEENSFLAYPGSSKIGEVQIFDAANLQAVTTIVAHDSPLAAMKFSMDGTKIATASTKGTVIRVFTVTTGERLFEFRRGMKRCVSIYSLAFSQDGLYLCSSSNTETIHVFKLEHPAKDSRRHSGEVTPVTPSQPAAGASGWISSFATAATNYLPTQVTDMLGQDRAFATAKLPHPGAKNVAALTVIKDHHRLMVASTDGYLYVYKFDPVDGGECGVVKQHCVLTTKQSGQQSPSPLNSLESPTKPNSSGGGGKSPHSYAASVVKGGSEATPSASGTPPGKKSTGEADSIATFSSPLTPLDNDEFHLQREIDSSRKAKKPIPLDDVDEFPPMTHTSQP